MLCAFAPRLIFPGQCDSGHHLGHLDLALLGLLEVLAMLSFSTAWTGNLKHVFFFAFCPKLIVLIWLPFILFMRILGDFYATPSLCVWRCSKFMPFSDCAGDRKTPHGYSNWRFYLMTALFALRMCFWMRGPYEQKKEKRTTTPNNVQKCLRVKHIWVWLEELEAMTCLAWWKKHFPNIS